MEVTKLWTHTMCVCDDDSGLFVKANINLLKWKYLVCSYCDVFLCLFAFHFEQVITSVAAPISMRDYLCNRVSSTSLLIYLSCVHDSNNVFKYINGQIRFNLTLNMYNYTHILDYQLLSGEKKLQSQFLNLNHIRDPFSVICWFGTALWSVKFSLLAVFRFSQFAELAASYWKILHSVSSMVSYSVASPMKINRGYN